MWEKYFLLICLILIVLIKAISDGYRYLFETEKEEVKSTSYGYMFHFMNFAVLLIPLLIIPAFFVGGFFEPVDILWLGVSFICIYAGIFDFFYNLVVGKHPLYIGDTALTDKALRKIFRSATSKMWYMGLKFLIFCLGILIVIDVM